MTLKEWLTKKFQGLKLELVALRLNIPYSELLGIINGEILPDYHFIIQVMYFFNLTTEEQLELFFLVGESLGISTEKVYNGVVEELVQMTNPKYIRKRQ